MAKSTGIVLTAAGISFANEWIQTNTPNFRIVIAGGGAALLITGIESLNEKLGIGFGVLMLLTVLITPFNGRTPVQTLAALPAVQPKG